MAIARIEINSTAGSNDDLVLGSTVTLSNADEGGELTYEWAILSQPSGAPVVLSSTTLETVTFPINKEGSYLIRLIVNKNLADESTDTVIAAVRELQTGNRIPAAGETTQNDAENGWANTAVDEILQRVTRMTDAGVFVAKNAAGASLSPGDVVHMNGMAVLGEGENARKVPTVGKALASNPAFVDGPLGVMVGNTTGASDPVADGNLCRVMVMGGISDYDLGASAIIGAPVYVSNLGKLSLTAGTIVRQVGDVAKATGGTRYDIAISAGSNSIPRGNALRDLSGQYPDPTVAKINGTSIFTAGGALTIGNVLRVTGPEAADWGAVNLSDTDAVTGTLSAARGGTGASLSPMTSYGLVYASSSTAMAVTAAPTSFGQLLLGSNTGAPVWLQSGTSGYLLKSNGTGSAPSWLQAVPINNGGTGAILATLNRGGVIYADTTAAMNCTPTGIIGQPLLSNGVSNPSFGALNLSGTNNVSGTLPVNLGGTGADLSDYPQGGLAYIASASAMSAGLAPTQVGQIPFAASNSEGGYAPAWVPVGTSGHVLKSRGVGLNPQFSTLETAAFASATIPYDALIYAWGGTIVTGTYANSTTTYTQMAQVMIALKRGPVTFVIQPDSNGTEFYNRVTTLTNGTVANVYIRATVTSTDGANLSFTQRFAMSEASANNQITGSISFPSWMFFATAASTYTVTVLARVGTTGDLFQASDYRITVMQG